MQYMLKRSGRARTMRLAVYPDGEVVVTAPRLFSLSAIEEFLAKHSRWIRRKIEDTRGRTVVHIARADIPRFKKQALALAEARCAYYAKVYGYGHGKITIRAQKTRWGSCSKSGNLSFNYKIAALPAPLAEYIIVHEICHLGAFNHSPHFWSLVAKTIPDYAARRKEARSLAVLFH